MAWPQSHVIHATSDNRFGRYKFKEDLGPGHNPEAYEVEGGRFVCYIIDGYYLGETINGPWERCEFEFDPRDRKIIEGLSNLTFARREDGSYLMICRGGGSWISKDGFSTWNQVSESRAYPPIKGRFEDPVVWRDQVQYHAIVNDWYGRIAYYLRSKDGIYWKTDAGEAYMPGIARYEDGTEDDWYKYERIKILQDEHGRAIQANFAVIDCPKFDDQPNDIHSSKNLSIPLKPERLVTLLNQDETIDAIDEIRVKIGAESDFDPQFDIDLESLRFGAPEEVDFGRGCKLISTEPDDDDLILVFDATGHGFTADSFAGELLGKGTNGDLLFGYTRLPWVNYMEPVLSARAPTINADTGKLELGIENFGQVPSGHAVLDMTIGGSDGSKTMQVTESIPIIEPYDKAVIALDSGWQSLEGCTFSITIAQDGVERPEFKGEC